MILEILGLYCGVRIFLIVILTHDWSIQIIVAFEITAVSYI